MKRTMTCDGAQFASNADFENMFVGRSIFFRSDSQGNRTTFSGDARFLNAHILGAAEFDGAEFKGSADFDSFQVGGYFFARPDKHGHPVSFGGAAKFLNANLQGTAEFQDVRFASAMFYGSRFCSHAWFMGARFTDHVDFSAAHFEGSANFSTAEFGPKGEARFTRCRFERGVRFDSAIFKGPLDFGGSISAHDAHFPFTQFLGPTSFRAAQFRNIYFGTPHPTSTPGGKDGEVSGETVITGPLDLRGFSYDNIYAKVASLLARAGPFDRQPYSQLEAVLRRRGDEALATEVYLERRRVERGQKLQLRHWLSWILDWGYKLVANYGVRPFRLALWAGLLILLGTAIFSQPQALEMRIVPPGLVAARANACVAMGQALSVSIHYFLPMDVPVGANCVPTENTVPLRIAPGSDRFVLIRPDYYAMILRIVGSLLVGLTIAAATGLLRRLAH
jgi:uncharacterized protein YjbI with pentapeptide repeats